MIVSLLNPSPAQGYPGGGYPGGGGPPAPSHFWNITYSCPNGTSGYHWMQANYQGAPVYAGTNPWSPTGNSDGSGGQYACDAAVSGTVTPTLTWVPATGQTLATDPPSEPVCILQTSFAFYSGGVGSGGINTGGNASDGLGDPCVNDQSQGAHLIQRDGSSGTIILDPVSLSANTAPYTAPPYGPNYAQAGAVYTAAIDTSGIMDVIATRVDATDPHHAKLYYHTIPDNAVVQTATFTAPILAGPSMLALPFQIWEHQIYQTSLQE